MAHWNLYDQACGASFDSTQAALSFDPRFTQAVSGGERAFRCLFLAENGWGEFKQSGPAGLPSGTVSLSAAWGTVKLRSLKIVSTAKSVAARVGASTINAAIDGGVVSFADGLTLTTGSTATITLTGGSGSQDADSVAVPIPGTIPGNSASSLRQRRCAGEDAECCPSGNRCGTEAVKAPADGFEPPTCPLPACFLLLISYCSQPGGTGAHPRAPAQAERSAEPGER